MPYIHFTEDQKLRANSVDLVEFLRRQGEKLIPSGRDKRLASDHSITVRGNEWYDHEAEEGGGPISFVQNFYGLTYPEAVTRLLGGEKGEVYVSAQKKERTAERICPATRQSDHAAGVCLPAPAEAYQPGGPQCFRTEGTDL